MKKIKLIRGRIGMNLLVLAGVLFLLGACQEDFKTKIKKHDPSDTVSINLTQPKVLYLIVDGLRGQIIPEIDPPTLTEMTQHAVYAYNGVSNDVNNNASTWADMLTGVEPSKHNIKSTGYAGNDLADYPMFFERLKESNPDFRTASFVSSDELNDHLISAADVKESFSDDDEAVKNAIINELGNEDATAILGEFNNIQEAGESFGYDSSIHEYVDAIFDFDEAVGDIMTALKQRENYKNENWLVIIASNKGGKAQNAIPPTDSTKFDAPMLNTFSIIYNPEFKSRFIPKPNVANLPYEGYAVKLQGKDEDAVNAYVPDVNAYNFGSSGEYTVQIKVNVEDFGTTWPSFFGKRKTSQNTSDPGWLFMFHKSGDQPDWRVKIGNNHSTGLQNLNTDEWHTLTMKIYEEGGKRWVTIYTDGDRYGSNVDITGENMDNNLSLTAGYSPGWTSTQPKLYITDIKIYDTALDDTYIDQQGGTVGLDENSPYYDNVIGYWPGTDGIGNKMKDVSPYHNDMVFNITDNNEGDFGWNKFSELSGLINVPLPNDIFTQVPRGVDMPLIIYKWMGLKISSWDLDGKFWLPRYTD